LLFVVVFVLVVVVPVAVKVHDITNLRRLLSNTTVL
jgi:hypothetical protein